jgi:hypothetical protein
MGAIRFLIFWGAIKELFSGKGRKITKQSIPVKLRVRFRSKAIPTFDRPDAPFEEYAKIVQAGLSKEEKDKILVQAVSSLHGAGIPFDAIKKEYFLQFRDWYVKGGGGDSTDYAE